MAYYNSVGLAAELSIAEVTKCHSRHHWRMTLGRMSARSLDLYQCVFMLSSGREVESDSSTRSFCKCQPASFRPGFALTTIIIYTGLWDPTCSSGNQQLKFSKWFVCSKNSTSNGIPTSVFRWKNVFFSRIWYGKPINTWRTWQADSCHSQDTGITGCEVK